MDASYGVYILEPSADVLQFTKRQKRQRQREGEIYNTKEVVKCLVEEDRKILKTVHQDFSLLSKRLESH